MPKKAKELKLEKIDALVKQPDPAKDAKKLGKKGDKKKKGKAPAPHADEMGRLNRVSGQINGIAGMLDRGRPVADVLTQFKAVHSALRSIELRVFETYVNESVEDIVAADKRKERQAKLDELKDLLKRN